MKWIYIGMLVVLSFLLAITTLLLAADPEGRGLKWAEVAFTASAAAMGTAVALGVWL